MDYYTLTSNGLKVRDFDIRHTIESAQPLTFYADYNFGDGIIEYPSGKNWIKAIVLGTSKASQVRLISSNLDEAKKDFAKRFRLKDDMQKIYSEIGTDKFMKSAIENYHGMRVTLNDPWETTLCFIMSQYNNVKRIRLIIRNFVAEFGTEILDEEGRVIGKSFPTSKDLTNFKETDFKRCGAGFRAKYITKAAEYCTNNLDLYELNGKSYDKIMESLMGIHGVGEKVAGCIALMGYGKMEAFPIDVWVKRTLENIYFDCKEKKITDLHEFARKKWGKNCGYAQQYIFHLGRNYKG